MMNPSDRTPPPDSPPRLRGAVLAVLLALAGGTFPARAASQESAPPGTAPFQWREETNRAFRVGESILYVIKYGFISSGFASLEIDSLDDVAGRKAYHVLSRARTNKATDVFFKVRDLNESWMDASALCSLRFSQNLREGLYKKETLTDYAQPDRRFRYLHRRKGKESVTEGDIPPFVQDVLSSLYYIRTRDLRVGEDILLDANSGGRVWPLKVHIKEIETIKVPAGKFECYHVEPILAGEGIFQQKGRLEVWLTKDEKKIPVLLRSRIMVGAFDAEMTEYKDTGSTADFLAEPEPAAPSVE